MIYCSDTLFQTILQDERASMTDLTEANFLAGSEVRMGQLLFQAQHGQENNIGQTKAD